MKCVAAIFADLKRTHIGTRSRLAEPLADRPILRRTIERLARATCLDEIVLLAPPDQRPNIQQLLAGLPRVDLSPIDCPSAPYADLVRAGRFWGLDGWRGGIGGLCSFDEDANTAVLAQLAQEKNADVVAVVPAAAPLIDPTLTDELIRHYQRTGHPFGMTFSQTPPGLCPAVFSRPLLEQMAHTRQPLGRVLVYDPDQPVADLAGKDPCYRPAAQIIESSGRLVCDTTRSLRRVQRLLDAGADNWDAVQIARWLTDQDQRWTEEVPAEIEIELTTEFRPAAESLLRPGAPQVPARGPIGLNLIEAVAAAIAGVDDVRIVLGGFGDPCCHPRFTDICRLIRPVAAAIAVRTPARLDDSAVESALFDTPIDVVEVTLDAMTRESYRRVHDIDAFDAVSARLDGWLARREAATSLLPIFLPSFVKSADTIEEMESFFDHWQRRLGMVLVTGYSHCAGQRPPLALTSMAPSQRGPCRRTFSRAVVLADGSLTTCDQDFAGRQTLGRLGDQSFAELWQHAPCLNEIRSNDLKNAPLCPACDEWHRP